LNEEQSNESDGSKRVPQWATSPLRAYLDDVEELERLLHLSMRGISMVRAMPKAFDALALVEPDEYASEDARARRADVGEYARLAQEEVDRGFPLLHAQAVISLWTGLECVIRNLAAAWFRNRPQAYQVDLAKRIRVRLGEYQALSLDERGYHIVELIEQEVSASLKLGVGRFEALLEPIGLVGGVPDAVRRTLFELSQIRNVLVHRRGVADRRVVEQCPWLNLVLGEVVIVSHEQFRRYHASSVAYIMELIQRLRLFFGQDRDPNLVKSVAEIERDLIGA
jgi:hypothetical protein